MPTALCLMFSIAFKPLILSTVGLFMMLLPLLWRLSAGIRYTAGQLKTLLKSKDANYMISSNAFSMQLLLPPRVWPLGVRLIQPAVNRLYFESQQSADHDA
jgi:hypothetical protein